MRARRSRPRRTASREAPTTTTRVRPPACTGWASSRARRPSAGVRGMRRSRNRSWCDACCRPRAGDSGGRGRGRRVDHRGARPEDLGEGLLLADADPPAVDVAGDVVGPASQAAVDRALQLPVEVEVEEDAGQDQDDGAAGREQQSQPAPEARRHDRRRRLRRRGEGQLRALPRRRVGQAVAPQAVAGPPDGLDAVDAEGPVDALPQVRTYTSTRFDVPS